MSGKRWHEGLTFCWQLSDSAIDRLAEDMTATTDWIARQTGATT